MIVKGRRSAEIKHHIDIEATAEMSVRAMKDIHQRRDDSQIEPQCWYRKDKHI